MNSMLLDTFYGNEKAKQTLVNWITDGRLSHAILLEGEDGSGKTTFARLIAASALCTSTGTKPCGECRNCRLVMRDAHPDVHLCALEDREGAFSIDQMREIRSATYILPNDGDQKFYILKNVHNMLPKVQSAMLGIIEEPPKSVHFLLTCNNRTRLLPTLLSRVQLVQISSCTPEKAAEALCSLAPDAQESRRFSAAGRAEGNIGRALRLLQDENLFAIDTNAQKAAETLCIGSEFELLCLFQPYTGAKKREDFLKFLGGIGEYFMQLLRQKNGLLRPWESRIPNPVLNRVSMVQGMKILELVRKSEEQVKRNMQLSFAAMAFCAAARELIG